MPSPSQDPPVELSRLLRRAARAASRLYRERLGELELTSRQANAVLALVEAPGTTLSGLADSLGADQATASALVDRLLSAGLVRRETDPDDRRKARLHPTEPALRLSEALVEARRDTEARIREGLGVRDSDDLARILQRLIDGIGHGKDAPRREGRERRV
jgi:DNA-binding MarR family transcriptional regulator